MRNTLICLAVFGGLLSAQGPGAWRRGPAPNGLAPQQAAMAQRLGGAGLGGMQALKDHLGLTDAQMEQIRNVRQQEAANMQTQAAAVRAKALELRQLVQSASPDAAKVGALTLELKQLREKMAASRGDLNDKVKAVLSPDQQAKLKELEAAAKLGPAARQAMGLGLIEAPQIDGRLAGRGVAGAGGPRGRLGARF